MTTSTIAKYLVQRLKESNVSHVFTVPGENLHPLYLELGKEKSIQIVPNTNEQEMCFAADGYSKIKRQPGCIAINFGSSSLQIVNAIAGSYTESTPIIIINAAPSLKNLVESRDQGVLKNTMMNERWTEIDIFKNVVVAAERIESSINAPYQIDHVIFSAISQNKPVYLEIPEDLFNMPTPTPNSKIVRKDEVSDAIQLEKATKMLYNQINNAKNPIILVGLEMNRKNLHDDFRNFIESSGIPYATTVHAKGFMDEENENFVGIYLGNSSNKQTAEQFKKADLVMLWGVVITDNDLLGVSIQDLKIQNDKYFVNISKNSVSTENFHASQVTIKDLISNLSKGVETKQIPKTKHSKFINTRVSTPSNTQELTFDSIFSPIANSPIVNGTSNIICDTSFCVFPISNLIVQKDQFVSQTGWGTKGYSLGAALGTFFANQKRPIIFVGDSGIQHQVQTLGSLAKFKTNAVIFVFNNGITGIEQWAMNPKVYSNPNEPIEPVNILNNWTYSKVVEQMNGAGFVCQTQKELEEVLKRVENTKDKICLVEIKLPQKDCPSSVKWRKSRSTEPEKIQFLSV